MSNQTIIHIGMHKTATTFLQNQYFKNLQGVSVYHPWRFYDRLGTHAIHETFLISNEGLSGVAWNQDWIAGTSNNHHWIDSFQLAVTNLKKIHSNASIIIVFRKHGDLLVSMYKQYIQEGGILPFEKFYGDHEIIRDEDLSYSYRLNFLRENFSKVYVLSFEKFRSESNSYLDNFFASIGIDVASTKNPLSVKNESITGSKVELLRKINRGYNKVPKAIRKGIQFIGLSPRYIFQRRLTFWKPKDSATLKEAAASINTKHKDDWDFIASYFWDNTNTH